MALARRLFFALLLLAAAARVEDDLYKILGVARTASVKDIKKAYRRKAAETHPDKNKGVPAEQAAEAFRKVVHAFEVLSDESSRKGYDRTGKAGSAETPNGGGNGGGRGQGGQWQSWSWSSTRRRGARPQMKDRFDVKEAMSRVMHVVSLAQLETVMLDDDGRLERNLLICFVVPGEVEKKANDVLVFPFPFAGMSSQGIWWEDILQTVMVRYQKKNELTKFFGIPEGDELRKAGTPIMAFAPRGATLADFKVASPKTHQEFDKWVWKMLEIDVAFENSHDAAVELYWIYGTRANLKATIQPGETYRARTMLSHEWYARDVNVDKDTPIGRYKLSNNAALGSWKIISDTQTYINIKTRSCVDRSGHCEFWSRNPRGECQRNPGFMQANCALTCGVCAEEEEFESAHDEL